MMEKEILLAAEHLTFRYFEQSKRPVLENISLELPKGSVTLLTGKKHFSVHFSGALTKKRRFFAKWDSHNSRGKHPGDAGKQAGTASIHNVSKLRSAVLYENAAGRTAFLPGKYRGRPSMYGCKGMGGRLPDRYGCLS